MKKLLSLFLALALLISLCGCNTSLATPTDTAGTTVSTTLPQTTGTETAGATVPAETERIVPPETQPETRPATQPTDPPQTQPETSPSLPPETQPATQPATEPETQATTVPETEPETQPETEPETEPETQPAGQLDPNGSYTSKEDVALYLHLYGRLPANFITKSQARALGWKSGSLDRYAPGKCIGGDRFYNREGLLPAGHTYYECDIDTLGSSNRGAKRIVYSDDGLIYYTHNHYGSFTLLYGEP